jgi:hypothetical protein
MVTVGRYVSLAERGVVVHRDPGDRPAHQLIVR